MGSNHSIFIKFTLEALTSIHSHNTVLQLLSCVTPINCCSHVLGTMTPY